MPIDIYNTDINIIYGDKKLVIEYLKHKYKLKDEEVHSMENTSAFCFRPKETYVDEIYIGKTKNNFKLISHECLHAGLTLFDIVNVNINPSEPSGQESLTYLVGYMVGYIQNAKKWYEYDFAKKEWKKK